MLKCWVHQNDFSELYWRRTYQTLLHSSVFTKDVELNTKRFFFHSHEDHFVLLYVCLLYRVITLLVCVIGFMIDAVAPQWCKNGPHLAPGPAFGHACSLCGHSLTHLLEMGVATTPEWSGLCRFFDLWDLLSHRWHVAGLTPSVEWSDPHRHRHVGLTSSGIFRLHDSRSRLTVQNLNSTLYNVSSYR